MWWSLAVVGCRAPPPPPVLTPWEDWRLMPHGSAPRLSADGARFVWLDLDAGAPAFFVGRTSAPDERTLLVRLPTDLQWWDLGPDALWAIDHRQQLLRIPLDGGPPARRAVLAGAPRWVEPRWPEGRILVAREDHGGLRIDALSLAGGEPRAVAAHPTADDVVLGADLRPRLWLARVERTEAHGIDFEELTVLGPDGPSRPFWQPFWVEDRAPFPRVGDGPVHLLAMASGEVRVSWGTIDVDGYTPRDAPRWGDLVRWLPDRATGAIDAVAESAERLRWRAADGDHADAADLIALGRALDSEVRVISRTPDDRWWVIDRWSGRELLRTEILDRTTGARVRVGRQYGGRADAIARRHVEARVLTARDGIPLAAYVVRPDPARWGSGPWPLVVDIHGGPWRGRYEFGPIADGQQAAERGYAWLAVNFRGTRGYGWDVMSSARYLGPMLDDVLDGIDLLVDEGTADPDRIAVMGASYGGDAALALATARDTRVRCTVAGLTYGDLVTGGGGIDVDAIGPLSWRREQSPDAHTDRLRGPVLLWSGGLDGAHPEAVGTFVGRAQAHGIAVTWLWFPDEGHGLLHPGNRMALDTVTDRFLARCLGGPAWPLHPGVDDGDFQVRAGALR